MRLWLTLPLLTACAFDDVTVDKTTSYITGPLAAPASQYYLDRAIKLPACTATRISARFALTAAHCGSNPNQTVQFYKTGPGVDTLSSSDIVAVHVRPGVNASTCDHTYSDGCIDSSGDFADIAILELAANNEDDEADLEGHQATLAWVYPGYGVDGMKVGAGQHNGMANERHPEAAPR
jgi:Trypsin